MTHLSILEALDNLNALVDADSLEQIEVTEDAHLIPHISDDEEGEFYLRAGADELTREAIGKTFESVHTYLLHFYERMRERGETRRLVEGINTVMVLVGEAANKLDRAGAIFQKKVTEFPEYQELQNFYRGEVIQQLFSDFARAPVQAPVEKNEEEEEIAGVHILNDVELLKNDHLYELFYLKNEAGHDFYTMKLAQNIKLACDFGQYKNHFVTEDPLLQVKNWEDRALHLLAQQILNAAQKEIQVFYKGVYQYKDMEIVRFLHFSVMALMLAANPRNLLRQFSQKGCHLYFEDFQMFLRATLYTREYERFLVYQPPKDQPFFKGVMDLIFALTEHFFLLGEPCDEVGAAIKKIVGKQKGSFADALKVGKERLEEVFAQHPNGPVFKALDLVRDKNERIFDPLMQGNVPTKECTLSIGTEVVRMPAPVRQKVVNRAEIAQEFKIYLRALAKEGGQNHLFINFHDRTSWREHARAKVLEELGRSAEFASVFTVVTLAKDTDFYNQVGAYMELSDAVEFKQQFALHLGDERTGYYFPSRYKEKLFPTWVAEMLDKVHEVFFEGQKELIQEERRDFISFAYLFIELKLLELVNPTYLTHCSKDGLDIGGTSTVGLLALLHEKEKWDEKEQDHLFTILYAPTILHRERGVHPERIARLESVIRRMENAGNYMKAFSKLFESKTLKIHL
ncbi:MAG: hypothetical protein H7A36_05770 [Chlamydiales bacterium]|nr:hypothetical protein [Chlamydiales bacterium]